MRQTGKFGQIMIPLNEGTPNTNVKLTLAPSKKLGPYTYVKRFFGHTATHWNNANEPTFVLDGLIGEVSVKPVVSVNDTVSIGVVQAYVGGVLVTTTAQRLTLTRDAAKNQHHTAAVNAAGSFAITTGVASMASFSDTYGADAGPALVSIGRVVAVDIRLTPGVAAPVAEADIFVTNLAGALIQERSDIPSGQIYALDGGVLFTDALVECHVGNVPRDVYATFYSQSNVLAPLGHTTKVSTAMTRATVELPAMCDDAVEADFSGPPKWSGTFERYAVDPQMHRLAYETGYGYIRLKRNKNDTDYREGAVLITGLSEPIDQGSANLETVTFSGSGPLNYVEA